MNDQPNKFSITHQTDGSWTYSLQPPLPAVTSFLTGGWRHLVELRGAHQAIEWFPKTQDYKIFCQEFGVPPTK
jgi:hypothetical protein